MRGRQKNGGQPKKWRVSVGLAPKRPSRPGRRGGGRCFVARGGLRGGGREKDARWTGELGRSQRGRAGGGVRRPSNVAAAGTPGRSGVPVPVARRSSAAGALARPDPAGVVTS